MLALLSVISLMLACWRLLLLGQCFTNATHVSFSLPGLLHPPPRHMTVQTRQVEVGLVSMTSCSSIGKCVLADAFYLNIHMQVVGILQLKLKLPSGFSLTIKFSKRDDTELFCFPGILMEVSSVFISSWFKSLEA